MARDSHSKAAKFARPRGNNEKPMTSMTLTFDRRTSDMLENLKEAFGAASKTEVIRKAIALLDIAREARDGGGSIKTEDADGVDHKILL